MGKKLTRETRAEQPIADSLFRGSCTCNIPTEKAYGAAEAAFKAIQRNEVNITPTDLP